MVTLAAVQMDANPAPASERLARAEGLVVEAARAGAQLVVLPELFSVGYTYEKSNYSRAESLTGPSASWMKDTAAQFGIHLAGSVLLREENEIVAVAQSRNVCEDVLRTISRNRQWTRNYKVKQALATNPRCPLPEAMKYLNYLQDKDLRVLMRSRDVPGAISTHARRILMKKGKV